MQSSPSHSWRQLLSAALAALLTLALLPGGVAARENLERFACPGGAPAAGFTDTAGSVHRANIDCLVWWSVARGTTATTFSPGASVRRDQMASFIARAVELAAILPAASGGFADTAGNTHAGAIGNLAGAGVVQGTTGTTFSPDAAVRRDQMASFLVRAWTYVTGVPPEPRSSGHFSDIAGNAHAQNIEVAYERGWALGDGRGGYGPAGDVRREQMATFLARFVGDLVDNGYVAPGGGLILSASVVKPGDRLTVKGSGFRPGTRVRIELVQRTRATAAFSEHDDEPADETPEPEPPGDGLELGGGDADGAGDVEETVTIPDVESGLHEIVAIGTNPDGGHRSLARGLSVDRDGPGFTSVSASPATAAPGGTFTITMQVTDETAVEYVGFMLLLDGAQRDFCVPDPTRHLASWELERSAGTLQNGTWTVGCEVPQDVQGGTYEIVPYGKDLVGNFTNTNCCTLSDTRGSVTISGGSTDREGPTIVSLSASPSTVSPGQTVTFTARITDDSGVKSAGVALMLDNGAGRELCPTSGGVPMHQAFTRTSGTAQDGTWSFACQIPQLVNNGTYEMVPMAEDVVGNYTNLNCCTESPTRAHFQVTGGSDDRDGPAFPSLSVSKASVGPGETFTITLQATDPTGVKYAAFMFMLDGAQRDFCGQEMSRTAGTAENGTWTHQCTVPDPVQTGTYEIVPAGVDLLDNGTNVNCCSSSATRAYVTVE